jgi:hypothetical protein
MRATLRRLYPRCWLARLLGLRDKYHLQVAEQGFITNYGHFVSREVALNLALISGQIISGRTNGELFSEDLY